MNNSPSAITVAERIADDCCRDRGHADWKLARRTALAGIRQTNNAISKALNERAEKVRRAGMLGHMSAAEAILLDWALTDAAIGLRSPLL